MNPVQTALQRVALLDQATAGQLMAWLDAHTRTSAPPNEKPRGAKAMIGFARRIGREAKTTAEWMRELRAGD